MNGMAMAMEYGHFAAQTGDQVVLCQTQAIRHSFISPTPYV